jgi:hypothetical protein
MRIFFTSISVVVIVVVVVVLLLNVYCCVSFVFVVVVEWPVRRGLICRVGFVSIRDWSRRYFRPLKPFPMRGCLRHPNLLGAKSLSVLLLFVTHYSYHAPTFFDHANATAPRPNCPLIS